MKKVGIILGIIWFVALGLSTEVCAQKSFQPKQIDDPWKGIIYRKESTADFTITGNGYGLAFNTGKIVTYYKTHYYHFELGYIFDPREQKQNRNIPISFTKVSQSFRFGKQNHVYVIRAGKGTKKLLTDKAKRKGVTLGYNYEIGPSLAILRPYYLELVYNFEEDGRFYNELRTEKYTEQNAAKFLDFNSIFGGTTGKGWSELGFVPGIQGKLGLFCSIGNFEKYAKALEVGLMGDLYIKKIPIMVETEAISAKPYFINFYISLQLGVRSN